MRQPLLSTRGRYGFHFGRSILSPPGSGVKIHRTQRWESRVRNIEGFDRADQVVGPVRKDYFLDRDFLGAILGARPQWSSHPTPLKPTSTDVITIYLTSRNRARGTPKGYVRRGRMDIEFSCIRRWMCFYQQLRNGGLANGQLPTTTHPSYR